MTNGISALDAANLRIKTLERIIGECVDVADVSPADVTFVEDILIDKLGCPAYVRQADLINAA